MSFLVWKKSNTIPMPMVFQNKYNATPKFNGKGSGETFDISFWSDAGI